MVQGTGTKNARNCELFTYYDHLPLGFLLVQNKSFDFDGKEQLLVHFSGNSGCSNSSNGNSSNNSSGSGGSSNSGSGSIGSK